MKCDGVLIPPDFLEPVCFVEEFTLPSSYEMSIEHWYPRSVFGEHPDIPTHAAHKGCNDRQGARVQRFNMTPEELREWHRMGAQSLTPEQRRAGTRAGGRAAVLARTPEHRSAIARTGANALTTEQRRKGAHVARHVNRNRVNPECALCREAS